MDELSIDNQKFVNEVVESGRFETPQAVLNEAVRLLRDDESGALSPTSSLTTQQWCNRFEHWSSGHHIVAHEADDRRESIYAGRSE